MNKRSHIWSGYLLTAFVMIGFVVWFLVNQNKPALSYLSNIESVNQVSDNQVFLNYATIDTDFDIYGIAFNTAENLLYLTGEGKLSVINAQNGAVIKSNVSIDSTITKLSFNNFTNTLFAHSDDNIIKLNKTTFNVLATYSCDCTRVTDIAFGQDGRMFVAAPEKIIVMDETNGNIIGSVSMPVYHDFFGYKLGISHATNTLFALPLEMESALLYKFNILGNSPIQVATFDPDIYSASFNLSADENTLLFFGTNLGTGGGILKQFSAEDFDLQWTVENSAKTTFANTNGDGQLTFAISEKTFYSGTLFALYSLSGDIFTDYWIGGVGIWHMIPFTDNNVAVSFHDTVKLFKFSSYQVDVPLVLNDYCAVSNIDDFSDINSGWPIGSSGTSTVGYSNGKYFMNHLDANRWLGVTRGDYWASGTQMVEVEGFETDGDSSIWGLIFGLNDDWTSFYTFEIAPNTKSWYVLNYSATSGWSVVASGSSNVISSGSIPNKLRISGINSSQQHFVINGTTVFSFSERIGRIGLSGASLTANINLRYDNYIIAHKNCPIPASKSSNELALNLSNIVGERPSLDEIPRNSNFMGD